MTRRRKGTGTVERTRDGEYRARFPFEPKKRETVGIYVTEEEAHDALDALVLELRDAGATMGGTPLRRVVEKMLEQRRAAGYSSVEGDEDRWETYFAEHPLASRPVEAIEAGDVLDAINGLRKKRDPKQALSLSTRKNILNLIRGAMKVALADGRIVRNVLVGAAFADPKGHGRKAAKRRRRALRWEQFVALWKASKQAPEIAAAIWTGARQGELRALHWNDVHNVEGSTCTCEHRRADPHIVIRYGRPPVAGEDCSPKGGSERIVPLFGLALEAFRTIQRSPTGIVFASRLKGYRAKGRLVGRLAWSRWKNAAALVGLRWHDLRHTAGTWLVRGERRMGIAGPWSLEAVKEMLGHAELRTTEIYADQREGTLAMAMAAEARSVKPATSPQRNVQVQSHLRDLNSRPTVYESGVTSTPGLDIQALAGLARAYVAAVERGDPLAHARGLDLAEAVLALAVVDGAEEASA